MNNASLIHCHLSDELLSDAEEIRQIRNEACKVIHELEDKSKENLDQVVELNLDFTVTRPFSRGHVGRVQKTVSVNLLHHYFHYLEAIWKIRDEEKKKALEEGVRVDTSTEDYTVKESNDG